MSIYRDWGYTSNPFKPQPLKPTEKGSDLLIGREAEKRKLKSRLSTDSGIVTIEGENGIGKTSVINASIFELYEDSIMSLEEGYLYIPCNEIFQISKDKNLNEFIEEIYYELAQTIIDKKQEIKNSGLKSPNIKNLNKWLNSATSINIEAQLAGFGGGFNKESSTTEGFNKSGFKKSIKKLLSEIFPEPESGGILCVIDNLELLQTSDNARNTLEFLRDELLTIKGIKWFFSGSHNIFNSIISSTRLSGFLMEPVKIYAITTIHVPQILKTRLSSFKNHVDSEPYTPIVEEDFIVLFESLNGNLREVFKKLSDYYIFVSDLSNEPHFEGEKNKRFLEWFNKDQNKQFNSINDNLSTQDFKLLRLLSIQGEKVITEKDFMKAGFDSLSSLTESIRNLEKNGLIVIPILENEYLEKKKYKRNIDLVKNIFISPKSHYLKNRIQE